LLIITSIHSSLCVCESMTMNASVTSKIEAKSGAPGPIAYGDKEKVDVYRLFNETCCLDIGERGLAGRGPRRGHSLTHSAVLRSLGVKARE
jgi:hypothetical protein